MIWWFWETVRSGNRTCSYCRRLPPRLCVTYPGTQHICYPGQLLTEGELSTDPQLQLRHFSRVVEAAMVIFPREPSPCLLWGRGLTSPDTQGAPQGARGCSHQLRQLHVNYSPLPTPNIAWPTSIRWRYLYSSPHMNGRVCRNSTTVTGKSRQSKVWSGGSSRRDLQLHTAEATPPWWPPKPVPLTRQHPTPVSQEECHQFKATGSRVQVWLWLLSPESTTNHPWLTHPTPQGRNWTQHRIGNYKVYVTVFIIVDTKYTECSNYKSLEEYKALLEEQVALIQPGEIMPTASWRLWYLNFF